MTGNKVVKKLKENEIKKKWQKKLQEAI